MQISNQMKLNIIGVLLLALLGVSAWAASQHLSGYSLFPLLCIGYAAFRVIFELTYNRANVPTLATGFVGRRKIAAVLQREVSMRGKSPFTIIDLGSGRGELTRYIANSIPVAQVTGIEIARIPCMQAAFVQRWLGPKNLSYQCCDFWPFDCSKIDAVVFYLTPTYAQRVGEKLHREMKSGSIVISHTFPLLGAWIPDKVLTFRSPFKEVVYVYRKE
ncbi:MAG: class I SAM-dependent methyltransferase [Bdellovibrionales bacterium]|jgi:SAM-dependent methyltransferase